MIKTGNDNNNKNAVINTAQTKRGNLWNAKLLTLMLKIVQIKFIAPKIDEAPDKWRLKIAKSIAGPEWYAILANGG